jgi:DNA repair protein RadC
METRTGFGTMTDLAPGDRPREKLERSGAGALGDNELVAVVLGHGGAGTNALATANRVLAVAGGVCGLTRVHRRRLVSVPGIGEAQASRVLAAIELGRRTLLIDAEARPRFGSASEIARFLLPRFGAYPVERFGVMLLDATLRLMGVELVSVGGVDRSLAHPPDVFRAAVTARASAVVLFHNHPSGDPTPSVDDVRLTQRRAAAGEVVGIDVVDHVILADRRYQSMRESRILPWRG